MVKSRRMFTYLAVLGLTLGLLAGPTFAQTSESTTNNSSTTAKTSSKSKKRSKKAKAEAASAKGEASSATAAAAETPATAKSISRKAKAEAASAESHASSAPQNAQAASNRGLVWVNGDSKVFHRSGDRWYGKTKNGKYMTEAEAVKEGYHLAKPGARAKSGQ